MNTIFKYCPACLRKTKNDVKYHFCSYCGQALTQFAFEKVKERKRKEEREGYNSLCLMASRQENLDNMIIWRNKTLY